MGARRADADDPDMLTAAVLASVLAAVLVELRHRHHLTAAEVHPEEAGRHRSQFLLETWGLTGVALVLLVVSQPGLT